jgi:hypothetical protein
MPPMLLARTALVLSPQVVEASNVDAIDYVYRDCHRRLLRLLQHVLHDWLQPTHALGIIGSGSRVACHQDGALQGAGSPKNTCNGTPANLAALKPYYRMR